MADGDISGSVRGPNGEQLQLRVGTKSVSGNMLGVVAVLIVAGAFLGGAVVTKILFLGQMEGRQILGHMQELLTTNNAKVTTGQHELRNHIDAALVRQDTLVHQQTGAIDAKLEAFKQYVEGWFTEVGTRMEILNHNIAHPERVLPLRAPLPREDYHPERGR